MKSRKTMPKSVKKILKSFVRDTSIHGVNFIAGQNRSKIMRFFWSFSFLISTILFGYNIYGIFVKWQIEPDILVKINMKLLSEIPFPAITLCSPMFSRDNLTNYEKFADEIDKNLTTNEVNYFAANIQSCNPSIVSQFESEIIKYHTDNDTIKLLNESSIKTNDFLFGCDEKTVKIECNRIFDRVLTDRGFCYSFNLQNSDIIFNADVSKMNAKIKWTLDGGYSDDHQLHDMPVAAQRDSRFGIYMMLNKTDSENLCPLHGNSFNYYLHLPNEILSPLHRKEHVKFHEAKTVSLTAKSYKMSDDLRKISANVRGCYFEGERKLNFFKSYTKSNCEYECMTNYTLKECGCVKFSMPRDKNTPVCDWNSAKCYSNAMRKWPNFDSSTDKLQAICGCLRTCSDIKYKVDFEETRELKHEIVHILRHDVKHE